MIPIFCLQCDKIFYVNSSHLNKQFCSGKCYRDSDYFHLLQHEKAYLGNRAAIKKHPNLYSYAGKICHKKHPELARSNGELIKNRYAGTDFFINIGKRCKILHPDHYIRIIEKERREKTGFFNPDKSFCIIGGNRGGKKTQQLHPELYKELGKRNGKLVHQLYPDLAKENGKKVHKLHPELAKNLNKILQEIYPDLCSRAGKEGIKSCRKNKKGWFDSKVQSKNALKANKSRQSKSPYKWEGVGFLSKEEREIARIILTKPIRGVNCHIQIDNGVIDFFPQEYDKMYQGKLVEYHPFDRKISLDEYEKKRLEMIENSRYKGTDLVVIKSGEFLRF